jgi:hypothetical protein
MDTGQCYMDAQGILKSVALLLLPFTIGVQIASEVVEARQRKAPVSQISSPGNDLSNAGATSPKEVAIQRPRIPRVAGLIARLTRPNHSLMTTVEEQDILKVREILNEQRKVDSESFRMGSGQRGRTGCATADREGS